jgi:hypothetical protein
MSRRLCTWTWLGGLALLFGAGLLVPISAEDDHATGKFGQNTVSWWQWVFRQPVSENPLFDETGADAANGQPNPQMFFLVGVPPGADTVSRTITVPFGKALFGAVVNYENDNIFYDPPVDVGQLRRDAATIIDSVESIGLTLDHVSRLDLVSRIKSPVFEYFLPDEDNIYQFFGVDISGTIRPAVSDGYWFYIPNLSRGVHTLHFEATVSGFPQNVTYTITVN